MRDPEDVLMQAPLEVRLGGQSYKIKPLTIAKSREWRKKAATEFGAMVALLATKSATQGEAQAAAETLAVSFPDACLDLLCAYAPDLPRKQIEQEATEPEVARAFMEVIENLAFPLLAGLAKATRALEILTGLAALKRSSGNGV